MKKTVLKEMNKCSGCGLCEVICPAHAIRIEYNKYGFLYPIINKDSCIDCGLCKKKCSVENVSVTYPMRCFAGINLDKKIKEKSSSGGIFAALAEFILEQGGVVFGAAVVPKNKVVTVEHIMIESTRQLERIQGSKYVQSNAKKSYLEIKNQLKIGKKVLFSGTPCQVAAVKNYLGKSYKNLLLVDLVCHGTPSALYWEKSLEEKLRRDERISYISFRGQGGYMQGQINFIANIDKSIRKENYNFRNDLYYSLFIGADSYREGCYQCQYARPERVGDISIGDFWGFEEEYDRNKIEKENRVNLQSGNSLVIVNTEKGMEVCNYLKNKKVWLYETDYESAIKYNPQLSHPSSKGKNRKAILTLYKIGHWKLVSFYGSVKKKIKNIGARV